MELAHRNLLGYFNALQFQLLDTGCEIAHFLFFEFFENFHALYVLALKLDELRNDFRLFCAALFFGMLLPLLRVGLFFLFLLFLFFCFELTGLVLSVRLLLGLCF